MANNELILAVDDEAHILELLSFNLEASGYRVVTAATGEDALVVCAHERPDDGSAGHHAAWHRRHGSVPTTEERSRRPRTFRSSC